jgi:hypothetical protein
VSGIAEFSDGDIHHQQEHDSEFTSEKDHHCRRSFLPTEAKLPRFINADLIAAGLAPFAPGGHHVPEAVIRRRFIGGLDNFHRHYKMAVDDWTLYDKTGAEPRPLELGENR